ncbi:tyrosine-type recombinase/integrase [candidate division WOR-3 bacterium]|nr:tyrosine-type recombinase/integrase [candidate division WOR-3 bacterium]
MMRNQEIKIRLFSGLSKVMHIGTRIAEKTFEHAADNTGIKRRAGVYFLGHSYATHLPKTGTDLGYIEEFLVHKNSKTTEIYTHLPDGMRV